MMRGIIALDIDGTVAAKDGVLSDRAVFFLEQRQKEGWLLAFLTGRICPYAMNALSKLRVPFILGLQNGADILLMPEKKVIHRSYFLKDVAVDLAQTMAEERFVLYAGYERGDFCYYNPSCFPREMDGYLNKMMRFVSTEWVSMQDFSALEQKTFPLLKAIGSMDRLGALEAQALKGHNLSSAIIEDPVDPAHCLLLISNEDATKGHALEFILDYFNLHGPAICAGDDLNDLPLLCRADIAIAMCTAPKEVQDCASIIAGDAKDDGVLIALKQAIDQIDRS